MNNKIFQPATSSLEYMSHVEYILIFVIHSKLLNLFNMYGWGLLKPGEKNAQLPTVSTATK
jgi:hypothetical protein